METGVLEVHEDGIEDHQDGVDVDELEHHSRSRLVSYLPGGAKNISSIVNVQSEMSASWNAKTVSCTRL